MKKQPSMKLPLHLEVSSSHSSGTDSSSEEQASPVSSASDRLQSIAQRNRQARKEEYAITSALANRAFHLPGYGYCADWRQYLINNHLVFGMCCRHPRHPIGTRMRAIMLVGSALFGLAITNIIWLVFIVYDEDPDSLVFKISFQQEDNDNLLYGANSTAAGAGWGIIIPGVEDEMTAETLENTFSVTKGMLLLWTVGGVLHAVYDSVIWYLSACACCLPGNRCERLGCMKNMGNYAITFVVVLVTAIATFAVTLRAILVAHEEIDATLINSGGIMDDAIDLREVANDMGAMDFVIGYLVEFMLATFVYYFLLQTVLFSGALSCFGCGRVAVLGGRPFEMEHLALQRSGL